MLRNTQTQSLRPCIPGDRLDECSAPCPASALTLASFIAKEGKEETVCCAQRLLGAGLLLPRAKTLPKAGKQHALSK